MAQHVTNEDQMQQLSGEHGITQGGAMGVAPTAGTHDDTMKKEHEGQLHLHRSGSSSSSSSEDDGEGGRRKKKGITEKIKETLTGAGGTTHDDKKEIGHDQHQTSQTTTTASVENERDDKKGMMDKIKDKIPGMH
ncbi:water stress-inducible protein Rab21-like [Solanum stenotomum]|uniref:water stress-inducible protein Rab21-like n=1 Tax=Solanum stenotomum TaxID=172797 RepID=UPI0020D11D20|nr:water stress-inducible protein Rab21-like [Solanum stenotomum]